MSGQAPYITFQLRDEAFRQRLAARHNKGKLFQVLTLTSIVLSLLVVLALLADVAWDTRTMIGLNATARSLGIVSLRPSSSGTPMVRITEVAKGSPGEQSGLKRGDEILSIGHQPVQAVDDIWQVALTARPGEAIPLVVKRGDEEFTVAITFRRSFWSTFWTFFNNFDSRFPERLGMKSAIYGTVYILLITALLAVPVGVGAAIYLEEYAPRHWLTSLIQLNIANLAGVPSVVYGIIGLEVLARFLGLGRSILAGGITMTLVILPIVIITAREALRAVPDTMRQAAFAVGATKWQAVRHHVLPYALPGIFTGIILGLSRAIGETAPLVLLGAFQYVPFVPRSLFDVFTVIPLQIFTWISKPQAGYQNAAAAAIATLLVVLLLLNALAIYLRHRFQRKWYG